MNNYSEEIINDKIYRVKSYIQMEYGDEFYNKINNPKHETIITGYVKNSMTLNPPKNSVPYIANSLVRYIAKTV